MSDDLVAAIKAKLFLEKTELKNQQNFYKKNIKPKLKEKYLSHLISTLEDLINNLQKTQFLETLEKSNNLDKIDTSTVVRAIKTKQLRLFTITLVPLQNSKRNAFMQIISGSVIIYFNSSLEEKQIRILIAHELGHLVVKYLFPDKENNEKLANLFAFIALADKNDFYKTECKNFTYSSDITILNEIANICKVKK